MVYLVSICLLIHLFIYLQPFKFVWVFLRCLKDFKIYFCLGILSQHFLICMKIFLNFVNDYIYIYMYDMFIIMEFCV